jgi:hypothetical protein
MTPDEKRAVAAMMQRLVIFIAERRSMVTILMDSVRDGRIPEQWEKELERLRATPEYHAILEQHAPTIRKLEEDADVEVLFPLPQKLAEGKLPN